MVQEDVVVYGHGLQAGDLRVILRKPDPPVPVEPEPHEFDDQRDAHLLQD